MKQITAILLVLASLLGLLPLTALAASSEEEALGEVDIYNSGQTLSYVCVNGRLQKLTYVYFKYVRPDGTTREIPAYCVNPTTDGVAQVVGDGKSVKYLAKDRASDPKIMGIISNGYPGRSLAELGLDNICQAYCATKLALWCYLLSGWDIGKLTPNPALSGAETQRAQRIIAAANDIYQKGVAWTDTPRPG